MICGFLVWLWNVAFGSVISQLSAFEKDVIFNVVLSSGDVLNFVFFLNMSLVISI